MKKQTHTLSLKATGLVKLCSRRHASCMAIKMMNVNKRDWLWFVILK